MKRLLGPLLIFLTFAAGIGFLLSRSAEAREVTSSALSTLFGIVTTPFVLETTVALTGLVVVLTYNQWRLQKEGDEWVEMEVPNKPAPVEESEGK
jgi:hypothetical protein